MVDERVITIVRLLGLQHGEMTITLQDVEVIMGMPIGDEAMVRFTKRT